ncbi:hypothetical protein PCASD_05094 [Puccinia coronata f. sp. avenae]|uniref:Uncharacterized protein n=1 Tax=Puccinia coronata f. sp. avenae TaxID=200324 RepID=A0A2N5VG76_9BASI|nr:hypothetical protein PCASD_05094 [Puccinia coronata f. sp. avenae]
MTKLHNIASNKRTRKKPANSLGAATPMTTNSTRIRTGCRNKKHNPQVKLTPRRAAGQFTWKRRISFLPPNITPPLSRNNPPPPPLSTKCFDLEQQPELYQMLLFVPQGVLQRAEISQIADRPKTESGLGSPQADLGHPL